MFRQRYRERWARCASPTLRFPGVVAPRILPPALRAQAACRAFASSKTPIVLRAAFAEIAGVGMLADQVDQSCPAEIVRELPGRCLVEPHQGRMQFEIFRHAEIERRL